MDRAYLQWTIVNWITVVLMASLGLIVLGFASAAIQKYSGGGNGNA